MLESAQSSQPGDMGPPKSKFNYVVPQKLVKSPMEMVKFDA